MATFPRDYSSLRLRLKNDRASSAAAIPKDKRCISDEELHQLLLKNSTMSVEVDVDTDAKLTGEETSRIVETGDKYLIGSLMATSDNSADEYQQQRSLLTKPHSPHHHQESSTLPPPTDCRPIKERQRAREVEDILSSSSSSSNSINRGSCHQLSPDSKNLSNRRLEFESKQHSSNHHHSATKVQGTNACYSHATTHRRRKMSPTKMNDKYVKSTSWSVTIMRRYPLHISDLVDIFIRVIFVIVFCKMETITAFKRFVHLDELPLYQNPRTEDYISPKALLLSVTMGPFLITLMHLFLTKDRSDFRAATWTWTLCLCLNGFATSLLKVSVGRPRPDYYYRCFPDGVMQLKSGIPNVAAASFSAFTGSLSPPLTSLNMMEVFNCTGSWRDINEGRKSFPSGHSSFAFASFGFIAYYLSGKLHAFNRGGRGESWRLCVSVAPMILATLVAVSRTCDYHHHWQDVLVGSLIGIFVSYGVYRLYYPSIFMLDSHKPHSREIRFRSTEQHCWNCCHRPRNRHGGQSHYRDSVGCGLSTSVNRYRRKLHKATGKGFAPLYDQEDEPYNLPEEEQHETEIFSSNNGHQLLLANDNTKKTLQTTPQQFLSKCF